MLSSDFSRGDTQEPTADAAVAAADGDAAAVADSIPGPLSPPHWDDKDAEAGEDDTRALLRTWLNERTAPVLLPYATVTIGNILELLANQTALLMEQQGDTVNAAYVGCLYQMEIERLKFMVASYLKCRLRKVPRQLGGWQRLLPWE